VTSAARAVDGIRLRNVVVIDAIRQSLNEKRIVELS
jgi:hypothetical protein